MLRVDYTVTGPAVSGFGRTIAQRHVSIALRRSATGTPPAQLERLLVRAVAADLRQVLREDRGQRKVESK